MHKSRNLLILISLILITIFGLMPLHNISNAKAQHSDIAIAQQTLPSNISIKELSIINHNSLHISRNRQYRIYSHHFLLIEHRDLNYLNFIGNRFASDTNNVYQTQYNQSGTVYHRFHDGKYWDVFHDQKCPSNFKGSHMNDRTYNFVNKRVLKSHGVYSGINYTNKSGNTYDLLNDN